MVHSVFMSSYIFFFFILLINLVVVVFGMNFDGQVLISLLKGWNVSSEIKSSWNASDATPCNWIGIRCNSNHSMVVSLNLSDHQIDGQLGPQIEKLRYLNELSLSNTSLFGTIPKELGNCSRLQHLDLSNNNLVGKLPDSFMNLQQLRTLFLFGNILDGEIPELLFQIPHLKTVHLRYSNLSGSVPFNIGNATELTFLDLSLNYLVGELPNSLNNLERLTVLDVYGNDLEGVIPLGLGNCKKLKVLDLSYNHFTGEIPLHLGNCSSLALLHMRRNSLTGTIPPSLGLLTEVISLVVGENYLSGKIPSEIFGECGRQLMTDLDLDNKTDCGCGSIPSCLGMRNLKYLSFMGNHIEGSIPRSLVNCKKLELLDLGNNQINDTFPFWLDFLPYLRFLFLRSNRFHGPIIINSQRQIAPNFLRVIDISSNYFSGELPSEYFSRLQGLMNSSLTLYPSSTDKLRKYVDYHEFLVEHLTYEGRAAYYTIAWKKFILEFDELPVFGLIDFSSNQFHGRIPNSLGQLNLLSSLNMSNNNFNGRIPSSLGNMTQLESLDLSENKLIGGIPMQLTDLSFLKFLSFLNLRGNRLTGAAPLTFSDDSFKGNLCWYRWVRQQCSPDDDRHGDNHPNPSAAPRIEHSQIQILQNPFYYFFVLVAAMVFV